MRFPSGAHAGSWTPMGACPPALGWRATARSLPSDCAAEADSHIAHPTTPATTSSERRRDKSRMWLIALSALEQDAKHLRFRHAEMLPHFLKRFRRRNARIDDAKMMHLHAVALNRRGGETGEPAESGLRRADQSVFDRQHARVA